MEEQKDQSTNLNQEAQAPKPTPESPVSQIGNEPNPLPPVNISEEPPIIPPEPNNPSTLEEKPKKTSLLVPLLIILLLATLGLAGFFGYKYWTLSQQPTKQAENTQPTPTPTVDNEVLKENQLTPVDEFWNKYTNYTLGFSINIPKHISGYEACNFGTYVDKELKVYENQNTVYISPSETTIRQSQTEKCSVIPTTINTFNTYKESEFVSKYIKMVINNNLSSEAEIESFIQKEYGSACTIGDITELENGNVTISINAHRNDDGPNPNCLISYAYTILYNESYNSAITWITGHEPFFQVQDPTTNKWSAYDEQVMESIVFF